MLGVRVICDWLIWLFVRVEISWVTALVFFSDAQYKSTWIQATEWNKTEKLNKALLNGPAFWSQSYKDTRGKVRQLLNLHVPRVPQTAQLIINFNKNQIDGTLNV